MKKLPLIIILSSMIVTGCIVNNNSETDNGNKDDDGDNSNKPTLPYGAFLGRDENNTKDFEKYEYLSFDFEGYSTDTIKKLEANGNHCMGYLNVGSIESYRSYYNTYKSLTFEDYENWPDERWIDVSNADWQNFVINTLAKNIKDKGGYGVYMDNVDVYSVCLENTTMKKKISSIVTGLKNIIKGVKNLGLKVMVNGGAEFFDDYNDDGITSYVWGYHQEEIFSVIKDYDKDIFGKQDAEDSTYYKEIAAMMKQKGCEVFLLEYTKDASLISQIKSFCESKNYKYYVSSTVDLK